MRVIPTVLALSLAFTVPAAAGPFNVDDVRAMALDKGIVKIEEVELDEESGKSKAMTQTGTRSR